MLQIRKNTGRSIATIHPLLLVIEMYKVKHNIFPCPIAEFVTKRNMHYKIRGVGGLIMNENGTITYSVEQKRSVFWVPRYGISYLMT